MTRIALLLLVAAASAFGAEPPGSAPESIGPGEIPMLDVEANVRKMLEASRSREDVDRTAPRGSAASPRDSAVLHSRSPVKPPPARHEAREPEDYVPLPEGTITIRSVGDVDNVARELQEARKRHGHAAPSPAGD